MANFDSIWNIALGVLSIVTAIHMIGKWINKRLPSKRLRFMYTLLNDADALFLSCSEEGLLRGDEAEGFRRNLTRLRESAEATRLEAHCAKSYSEDFTNMLKGLTQKIDKICKGVKVIRAEISTSSMRERERRAAQKLEDGGAAISASVFPPESRREAVSSVTTQPASEAQVGAAVNGVDAQVATPLGEAATPLRTTPRVRLPAATSTLSRLTVAPRTTHALPETVTTLAPFATIRWSRKQMRHGDRRCFVSSNSSGSVSSELARVQLKYKGDPLSRARTMATLLRYTRARESPGLPVYVVDPQQLTACELAEDDSDSSDDGWEDELGSAVRIVA